MKLTHAPINDKEKKDYLDFSARLTFWNNQAQALKGKELAEFKQNNPEPVEPTAVFSDATVEPVLDKFIDRELINGSWSTDEAGHFFGGYTMKGETALNALSALTTLWSSGTVTRMRSKRNQYAGKHTRAYDVRLTMLLMGQRVALEKALNDPEMNGQGFLARALIAAPQDMRGRRVWNDPARNGEDAQSDPRLVAYWDRCREILSADTFEAETAGRYDMPYENQAAAKYFYDKMQSIENEMNAGGAFEYLKGYASRMAENASRIAAIMAHFDKRGAVSIEDLKSAFLLVHYAMRERMRYADAGGQDLRPVEKLSQWLVENTSDKTPPKIAKSKIRTHGPSQFRSNKRGALDEALELLEEAGHIKIVKEGTGRPKTMVYINPALFD